MPTKYNPFEAVWSAKGHTLCLGHWSISFEGKPLDLPQKQRDNHMNTYGIFSWLYPDDEDFAEGLTFVDWVEQNAHWLCDVFDKHVIPFDEQHINWFYQAVNSSDWRCGSCGGCL